MKETAAGDIQLMDVLSPGFYEERAEECEARAAEATDPRHRAEWLLMAEEWRRAAQMADEESLPPRNLD